MFKRYNLPITKPAVCLAPVSKREFTLLFAGKSSCFPKTLVSS